MTDLVDLRSDTLTTPTPEMRRAMADAEVRSGSGRLVSVMERQPGSRSTRSTMRSMMLTAS